MNQNYSNYDLVESNPNELNANASNSYMLLPIFNVDDTIDKLNNFIDDLKQKGFDRFKTFNEFKKHYEEDFEIQSFIQYKAFDLKSCYISYCIDLYINYLNTKNNDIKIGDNNVKPCKDSIYNILYCLLYHCNYETRSKFHPAFEYAGGDFRAFSITPSSICEISSNNSLSKDFLDIYTKDFTEDQKKDYRIFLIKLGFDLNYANDFKSDVIKLFSIMLALLNLHKIGILSLECVNNLLCVISKISNRNFKSLITSKTFSNFHRIDFIKLNIPNLDCLYSIELEKILNLEEEDTDIVDICKNAYDHLEYFIKSKIKYGIFKNVNSLYSQIINDSDEVSAPLSFYRNIESSTFGLKSSMLVDDSFSNRASSVLLNELDKMLPMSLKRQVSNKLFDVQTDYKSGTNKFKISKNNQFDIHNYVKYTLSKNDLNVGDKQNFKYLGTIVVKGKLDEILNLIDTIMLLNSKSKINLLSKDLTSSHNRNYDDLNNSCVELGYYGDGIISFMNLIKFNMFNYRYYGRFSNFKKPFISYIRHMYEVLFEPLNTEKEISNFEEAIAHLSKLDSHSIYVHTEYSMERNIYSIIQNFKHLFNFHDLYITCNIFNNLDILKQAYEIELKNE